MANQDQHQGEPGADSDAGQLPQGISPQGAARRRFARAGLGASGVIMTLVSQPGMATTVCRSPSGFVSGIGASGSPTNVCSGLKPETWKKFHDNWNRYGNDCASTHPFRSVFTCSGRAAALQPYTLFEVLDGTKVEQGADRDQVAMHCIAALLNARAGKVSKSVLSAERVREIWSEYARTGVYTPSAGATQWDGDQIRKYLRSTMGDW